MRPVAQKLPSTLDYRSDGSALLIQRESEAFRRSLFLIDALRKKHQLDFSEVRELLLNQEKYASVPVGIFRSDLSPLECLVRYLHESRGYAFSSVSSLIHRDQATVWTTYQNGMKKKFEIDLELSDINFRKLRIPKGLVIPLRIFSDEKLSVLEAVSLHLRQTYRLNYHHIGLILKRNDRTIWTVVHRALKKLNGI